MIDGIDLEINDLFENDNDDPGNDNEGGVDNPSKSGTKPVEVKPRRVVRNPQPKLNPQRLGGSRGLIQLPKIFSEVRLKGEGHEKENLDVVMKTLEHWSYRLFPRFPFDDVLEKIEKLGAKKQVQTCLKKIRLDMLTDDDLAPVRDDYDDNVDGARAGPCSPPPPDRQSNNDLFDDIFTSTTAPLVLQTHTQRTPTSVNIFSVLTDEQIEKMERNRHLAMERRAAKLQQTATEPAEAESLDVEDNQEKEKTNETEGEKKNETEMLNENELLAFLDDDL